ncbi:MAG: hypothetical protein IKM93_08095 [Bacteroidales bacterium]|nr:hypothetical protein [Bacteroidales bacterium]
MNYLLYQPAILADADRVYLNGDLVEEAPRRSEVYDTIVSLFNKMDNSLYPSLDKVDGFYLLRGLFDAKDEKGRTLSFLFASDSDKCIDELSAIAKTIGYRIDASTLNKTEAFLQRNKKNRDAVKYISLTLLGVIIILILLLL